METRRRRCIQLRALNQTLNQADQFRDLKWDLCIQAKSSCTVDLEPVAQQEAHNLIVQPKCAERANDPSFVFAPDQRQSISGKHFGVSPDCSFHGCAI